MNRETRIGIVALVALGAFVAFMLVVGNLGEARPGVDPLRVDEVLADASPADRYGDREVEIAGWYAELAADCEGDDGGSDASVAWLQRDCPLRVLLPQQPPDDVTQEELEASGLRLAAPQGAPFPSRAVPTGPNLRIGQLVFTGHFDDAAAGACVPERIDRCRNTFVVNDHDDLVR